MVSQVSTLSVMVTPVGVFTKICIPPRKRRGAPHNAILCPNGYGHGVTLVVRARLIVVTSMANVGVLLLLLLMLVLLLLVDGWWWRCCFFSRSRVATREFRVSHEATGGPSSAVA